MAIPTTPFDAATYRTDAEAQFALLNEALDTRSAAGVVHAIRTTVRARDVAEPTTKVDIAPTALSDSLADGSGPTLAVLHGPGFALQARSRTTPT